MAALRRNTELGLILLGALITVGAYALGSLGRLSTMPADIGPFLVVVLGLLLAAHVATRILAPGADGTLLPLAALLNGIGYVFIARLDPHLAGLQATWTAIGVAAYIGTLVVVRRVRDLRQWMWTFALVGIGLLLLPLVPGVGRTINGARIWVSLGPVNFQPGEPAKLALALFFAAYLVERRELLARMLFRVGPLRLPEPRHLLPVLLAWMASLVVMVAQKDLGSSLLFFALFIVMLWVSTERASYLGEGAGMVAAGAVAAWSAFAHVQERVSMWLNPWQDPQGNGYQIIQGSFAMAWGGLVGTGNGLGDPGRVPAAETDFIFAANGEELGLVGATAVLVAFLLMVGAGLRIAVRAEASFDKLLAAGLTTIVGLQSFIIIGGVVRLVPLTGVTLPFVSYGGSSLVANYVLLALLMRISSADEPVVASVTADATTIT
jgi:peptidoglycan glycosyltransferase